MIEIAKEVAVNLLCDWLRAHPEMILGVALLCVILFTVFVICTDKKIKR